MARSPLLHWSGVWIPGNSLARPWALGSEQSLNWQNPVKPFALIKGMHALFYTPKAEELRAFIRDKLELPFTDTGSGWLIFDVPEADLGCHPSDEPFQSVSFYCDDIKKTVKVLESRGVEFTSGISDRGWGLLTHFRMPGNLEVELYQPKYKKKPHGKTKTPRRARKSRQPSSP